VPRSSCVSPNGAGPLGRLEGPHQARNGLAVDKGHHSSDIEAVAATECSVAARRARTLTSHHLPDRLHKLAEALFPHMLFHHLQHGGELLHGLELVCTRELSAGGRDGAALRRTYTISTGYA